MDNLQHLQMKKNEKNLTLPTPGIEPRTKISPNIPNTTKSKKMKKKFFFRPYQPRESNPRPNTLKRTPKWPNIGNGPLTRVYNKCLAPRPLTPSQRFDHYVLFIYGHYPTPPNWKKRKKLTLPTPGIEPRTKISPNVPNTTKSKKMKKKFFFRPLPTPGIEPTTKRFKADAKIT